MSSYENSTENHTPNSEKASPLVRPAAQGQVSTSADVSGRFPDSSATNTSPPSGAKNLRHRLVVGTVVRARLRAELADRDRAILAILGTHRFLSTHQVQQFCFPTSNQLRLDSAARETRRTLLRLKRAGALQIVTARRVGGIEAGSNVQIWQLTSAGYRLASETVTGGLAPTLAYRTGVPTTRFLAHELAIADAHLAAMQAATDMTAALQVQIEKRATRTYTGLGGAALRLTPDLALRLSGSDADGAYEDYWFVEVDLGTESLPTLVRKCEQYETYFRTGTEQARTGIFPLVLWRFHGGKAETRRTELQRRIQRVGRLTAAIHRFATSDAEMHHELANGGVA
ncbi:replication-relaxation family protein [Leekyejoonella antrihumi]|uniref:Replication-relaxation n=1 Tax=Leekyejoonella antrihumi TaxID=1660198 RepID=A0A563DWM2_9MICO|nr:replication-relaxation family protein [Leekyejoonella antrihumi]TWP34342.1 hypothetical protein FGL98_18100 [Leekyejoonella antrihumi]